MALSSDGRGSRRDKEDRWRTTRDRDDDTSAGSLAVRGDWRLAGGAAQEGRAPGGAHRVGGADLAAPHARRAGDLRPLDDRIPPHAAPRTAGDTPSERWAATATDVEFRDTDLGRRVSLRGETQGPEGPHREPARVAYEVDASLVARASRSATIRPPDQRDHRRLSRSVIETAKPSTRTRTASAPRSQHEAPHRRRPGRGPPSGLPLRKLDEDF